MLKAYAVALVLSTSAPVADKNVEGADAPAKPAQASSTQVKHKPKTGGIVW
ncbi:hypothetical protein [Aestuariibacter salexigens]|uniref:hypothetical protein n=1 Tax=Aestuariibacter salexigens TaxID=226010 RepID=UPI00040268E9|nr:hypothetical protein [Aestuariibacter salexigens]